MRGTVGCALEPGYIQVRRHAHSMTGMVCLWSIILYPCVLCWGGVQFLRSLIVFDLQIFL